MALQDILSINIMSTHPDRQLHIYFTICGGGKNEDAESWDRGSFMPNGHRTAVDSRGPAPSSRRD